MSHAKTAETPNGASAIRTDHVWGRLGVISFVVLLILGLATGPGAEVANAATDPKVAQEFVDDFIQHGLDVLQSTKDSEEKVQIGKELMAQSFDLPVLSRFVLGRYARRVKKSKLREYQIVYFNYVAHTYLAKLAGTTDNSYQVAVTGSEPTDQGDALVQSDVTLPNGGDTLEMQWRVRKTRNGYRIIDMYIAGVSLAVAQRSEFASILKRDGIDGLITAMRDQAIKSGGNPDAPLPVTAAVTVEPEPALVRSTAPSEPGADEKTATEAGKIAAAEEAQAAVAEPASLKEERKADRAELEKNRSEARALLEETQRLLEELNKNAK